MIKLVKEKLHLRTLLKMFGVNQCTEDTGSLAAVAEYFVYSKIAVRLLSVSKVLMLA